VVICLERGADLHIAQLMPLPLTVSCSTKIQIDFTFLVPVYPGSPGKGPLNVCVCVCFCLLFTDYCDECVACLSVCLSAFNIIFGTTRPIIT